MNIAKRMVRESLTSNSPADPGKLAQGLGKNKASAVTSRRADLVGHESSHVRGMKVWKDIARNGRSPTGTRG
jgi:hypothetical protein